MVEASMLTQVIISRFLRDLFASSVLLVPKERPIPIIGPIIGDMSIAPITTGMELVLRPTLAMMVAKKRIHRLAPLKSIFDVIYC